MLSLVSNKNIYLGKVGDKQWKFVYGKSLNLLMKRFDNACDIMAVGNYEVAIDEFRTIIKEVPNFIDAYNQLGLALSWSGFEEGHLVLEEGIKNILPLFQDDFFENHHRLEWGWLDNRSFLRCYTNLGLSYFEIINTAKPNLYLKNC